MGNRWMGYTKKRTVESCERINAREAAHVGCRIVEVQIGGTKARRLLCLCECGGRSQFLYRPQKETRWACRQCHDLAYTRQQQRGTVSAFWAWLTPERWEKMSQKHPATKRMYEAMGEVYVELCAPYEWDKLSAEQQAKLLTLYASENAVRRVFDQQRQRWADHIEELAHAAGEEIRRDLWAWWKRHNRSKPKPKAAPTTFES